MFKPAMRYHGGFFYDPVFGNILTSLRGLTEEHSVIWICWSVGFSDLKKLFQSLLHIVENIITMFQSDCNSDESGRYTNGTPFIFGQFRVSG